VTEAYPSSWFRPGWLRQLLGNFWDDCGTNLDVLHSLLTGRAWADYARRQDIDHFAASLFRATTPLTRQRDFWPLRLQRSAPESPALPGIVYGQAAAVYQTDGSLYQRETLPAHCFTVDPAWVRIPILADHLERPQRIWVEGNDYTYQDGTLRFYRDIWPELTPEVPDGSTAWVFVFGGQYDQADYWRRWSYPFQVPALPDHPALQRWTEAVWQACLHGSSELALRYLLAALADIPCATNTSTVRDILYWHNEKYILTDTDELFILRPQQRPAVSIGQTLQPGDFLAQTLTWWDCAQQANQAPPWLPVLALGRDYLGSTFLGELLWPNQLLPTQVREDTWTELRLAIGGHPGAVETFWQQVQARGIAQGQTLAMQLAPPDPLALDVQPTAAQLPSAVNPLVFWLTHGWPRAVLVRFLRHQQGDHALPLAYWRWLKHLIPADALLVLVEQQQCSDTCRSETIQETISLWHGQRFSEILTPSLVQETVQLRLLPGWCE